MANSFHLWWAQLPQTTYDRVSVILRVVQKPPATADLVYWAGQVGFRQVDGTARGAAHFGLQAAYNKANATKTAVNFGGYDSVLGGGTTFRGSIPTHLPGWGDPGNTDANSPLFEWFADRDYLLDVRRSPKQNWLDAELTDPAGNVGGDQAVGEVAFRFTLTDLSTGAATWIRDLLIPNCHPSAAMDGATMWAEDFNDLSAPTATEPWDIRWTEPRVDGRLATAATVNIPGPLTNTDVDVFDRIGFRQRSVVGRSVTQGQQLLLPGPAVRGASREAVGDDPARSTLTLAVDAAAVAEEPLLAIIGNHPSGAAPSSPGWELVGEATDDNANDIRMAVFRRLHDPAVMSHVFTVGGNTNNLAGCLLALYGADPLAPPVLGPVGISVEGAAGWSAPEVASKVWHYARVLAAVANAPQGSDRRVTWPVGVLEVANSADDSGAWTQVAVGQEATPAPAGAAPAKTGGTTGSLWQGIARQIIVPPLLQRARPTSDIVAGWGDPPLASKIGEAVRNDATFITGANGQVAEVALDPAGITDPGTDGSYVLRYAYRRQSASSGEVLVQLKQGATVIASKTQTVLAGDPFVLGELKVTAVEGAAITNHGDLRLRLTSTVL